ncbi:MAG: hypothetical protein J4N68_07455, partial [Chloroflexi bacterium]|nr:hypothetical protein [Chloroflexota bacterium]
QKAPLRLTRDEGALRGTTLIVGSTIALRRTGPLVRAVTGASAPDYGYIHRGALRRAFRAQA